MNLRYVAVVILAMAVAAGASTAGARTTAPDSAKASKTINVWLMTDASESPWKDVVAAANRTFEAQHPDTVVKVEIQTWGDHLTKLDAALAGGRAPDVIELGNTETTKYMAAGALANLSGSRRNFQNNRTWLAALTQSCTYGGKLFCVPYYAGARAVIYRTDVYRKAGLRSAPKSLDQFIAIGKKAMQQHKSDRFFSALYFPGKYWYAALSFVYDYGGAIARFKGGRWVGTLNSRFAVRGLETWKETVTALSRANRSGTEFTPQQWNVFAQGHVGATISNGWEWGLITDAKTGNPNLKLAAFPVPSHTKGKFMPTFLGGSDLAIPATSQNRSLAIDWIRTFTGTQYMRQLTAEAFVIPNTTSLANVNAGNPKLAPFAQAAKASWFVPTAPNWANVESAGVLQNMLASIATGRSSVQKAANRASGQITQILNAR
jgi:N,N'-diacetylchitobiose transport system substrate-binding protein